MTIRLNSNLHESEHLFGAFSAKLGKPCRVKLLKADKQAADGSPAFYKAFLVDHGLDEIVSAAHLIELTSDVAQLEPQCICCALGGFSDETITDESVLNCLQDEELALKTFNEIINGTNKNA